MNQKEEKLFLPMQHHRGQRKVAKDVSFKLLTKIPYEGTRDFI